MSQINAVSILCIQLLFQFCLFLLDPSQVYSCHIELSPEFDDVLVQAVDLIQVCVPVINRDFKPQI